MSDNAQSARRQEFRAVTVLAFGFGLVGVDRFLISTLFPVIAKDLHLSYGDIGTITGVLAIAWGTAALLFGNLSDRIGRRRVLVAALVVFSLLIGSSGLAEGLMGLILVRIVMGFADGAFTPASISATLEASPPARHGRNIGVQQMTLTLFGLGLSPLLVTALLHVINWRLIFSVFVIPGLLIAWATFRIIPARAADAAPAMRNAFADWRAVLAYSNIRVLMVLMLCWLTCLVTTSALMPNYLLDHLKLSFGEMGTIMSAIGLGSMAGTLILPWLSDGIGRKPVMLISTVGAGLSLVTLNALGPAAGSLFAALFMVHFFNNALITLTVGPLCAETVPPALMATASGVVIAVGEFFGGGLAPVIGGQVAERFGIDHVLWLPIAAMALGFGLCTMLKETRPAAVRRAASA
ncbi:MAG: MFS transporter [Alphaproteobacteria bacterium]|nr:MFS transporter [Alphaproteobacteria bacterium]